MGAKINDFLLLHDCVETTRDGVTVIPFWTIGANVSFRKARETAGIIADLLGDEAVLMNTFMPLGVPAEYLLDSNRAYVAWGAPKNSVIAELTDLFLADKIGKQTTAALNAAFANVMNLPKGSVAFRYDSIDDQHQAFIHLQHEPVPDGLGANLMRFFGRRPSYNDDRAALRMDAMNAFEVKLKPVQGVTYETDSRTGVTRVVLTKSAVQEIITTANRPETFPIAESSPKHKL